MSRLILTLWIVLGLTACSRPLPPLMADRPSRSAAALRQTCRDVFPRGRWQFVHTIEARFPDGSHGLLLGTTRISAAEQEIVCALMTMEGLVLFQARWRQGQAPQVERALPPFHRRGFAEGVLGDIRLLFVEPRAVTTAAGELSAKEPACRYRLPGGGALDVIPGSEGWRLIHYGADGRVEREVSARMQPGSPVAAAVRWPERIILNRPGPAGYRLALNLIEAIALKP